MGLSLPLGLSLAGRLLRTAAAPLSTAVAATGPAGAAGPTGTAPAAPGTAHAEPGRRAAVTIEPWWPLFRVVAVYAVGPASAAAQLSPTAARTRPRPPNRPAA